MKHPETAAESTPVNLAAWPARRGVRYLSDPALFAQAGALYLQVRKKEGRVYPDHVVRHLPRIREDHPLRGEWEMRARSVQRLCGYLEGLERPINVLDVGCGNGWMSARLAERPQATAYGLDVNRTELEQAAQAFAGRERLHFLFADVLGGLPLEGCFDVVVLAGSVQYFADLGCLLSALRLLLAPEGEIHIMDSPFYSPRSAPQAAERSRAYYASLGLPEMATHYHHHRLDELRPFDAELLHNPRALLNRVGRRLRGRVESPFPWIRICPHR